MEEKHEPTIRIQRISLNEFCCCFRLFKRHVRSVSRIKFVEYILWPHESSYAEHIDKTNTLRKFNLLLMAHYFSSLIRVLPFSACRLYKIPDFVRKRWNAGKGKRYISFWLCKTNRNEKSLPFKLIYSLTISLMLNISINKLAIDMQLSLTVFEFSTFPNFFLA